MGLNTYLLLCLAFATRLKIAHAEIDKECIYEGQRFELDRAGQLPLETHRNFRIDECEDYCNDAPTCVIWQYQPTAKICWIMNVKPFVDKNSDFGINNCDKGQPTDIGPLCRVTKGDRNNVWKDYQDMTKEECMAICNPYTDCLIWQYITNRQLCRIHKLEVDRSKQSYVGLHYCSDMPRCFGLDRMFPTMIFARRCQKVFKFHDLTYKKHIAKAKPGETIEQMTEKANDVSENRPGGFGPKGNDVLAIRMNSVKQKRVSNVTNKKRWIRENANYIDAMGFPLKTFHNKGNIETGINPAYPSDKEAKLEIGTWENGHIFQINAIDPQTGEKYEILNDNNWLTPPEV